MKKILAIAILCSSIAFGQTSDTLVENNNSENNTIAEKATSKVDEWTFKINTNLIDNSGDFKLFNAFTELNRNAFGGAPITLGVEKRVSNLLGVQAEGSFNTWEAPYGVIDRITLVNDESYASIDVALKLYLSQLSFNPIKIEGLDFYATGGIGFFKIDEISPSFNFGGGAAYWFSDAVGVNFDLVTKIALNSGDIKYNTSHVQYSFGLVFKMPETNLKDIEPEYTQEELFQYYYSNNADTDGDGVVDKLDKCVEEVGPFSNLGCPFLDSDGDGVIDNVDNCINIAGSAENKGCPLPDRDKDGVIDRVDKCPDTPGSYRGCPYIGGLRGSSGGDGFNAPVTVVKPEQTQMIKYGAGSKNFILEKEDALSLIADYIKSQPEDSKFRIEGHTDSTGSDSANKLLSKTRANLVRDYLVGEGIAKERLITVGFGDTRPIDSNLTQEGRSNNRRIEIVKIR